MITVTMPDPLALTLAGMGLLMVCGAFWYGVRLGRMSDEELNLAAEYFGAFVMLSLTFLGAACLIGGGGWLFGSMLVIS